MNSIFNEPTKFEGDICNFYNKFIRIDLKSGEPNEFMDTLYDECITLAKKYRINKLTLSLSDRVFVNLVITLNDITIKDFNHIDEYLQKFYIVFSVYKYLYVRYYSEFHDLTIFKNPRNKVMVSFDDCVLDKFCNELNYVLKLMGCDKTDSQTVLSYIKNSEYIREISKPLCNLYASTLPVTRTTNSVFLRELRSRDFFCCIQSLFGYCNNADDDFLLVFDSGAFGHLFKSFITLLLCTDGYLNLNVLIDDCELNTKDYSEENRILKVKIKELRRKNHAVLEESRLFDTPSDVEFDTDSDDIFVEDDNLVKIDFNVSLEDKKSLLDAYNIIFLKSKDIDISLDLKNTRIYDIENVPQEVFSNSIEYVVIGIKGISHSDVFRVKSLCKGINIIYTSRINNKLIIEDIFSRI